MKFRFNPPTKVTFYISVALAVIGLVLFFAVSQPLWGILAVTAGYVYLVAGLFVKGM